MNAPRYRPALTLVILLITRAATAQEFDEKFEHWPVDLKINGTIAVAGELSAPAIFETAMRRVRNDAKVTLLLDEDADEATVSAYRTLFIDEKADEKEDSAGPADGET